MLLIDNRAGSNRLIPLLPPNLVRAHRLEAGDVAFLGYGPDGPYSMPIGIEYKTAKEALQRMHDNGLTSDQLPRMAQIYQRVYILIEGEYQEGPDGILQFREWRDRKPVWVAYSKTSYRAFDNWQNSIAEVGRVIIRRSMDKAESAAIVLDLYHFWAKDYDKHMSVFKLGKDQCPAKLSRASPEQMVFFRIPGIGDELSSRVAAYFENNIHRAVNAEVTEWLKIPGLGKSKAQKIYNFLRKIK